MTDMMIGRGEGKGGRSMHAAALAICVFVYYLVLTWHRYDLVVAADEVGFVSNAWFLSGTRAMFHMTSASYYPWGYSLLIAPVFWVTTDPHLSYHLGVVVNCLLVAFLTVNLFYIWRRYVDGRVWLGFFVCLVVGLYPALQLNAGMLWSETGFVSFFVLYANVASLFIRRPNALLALMLCFFGVYLYAIHQRALLLPLLSVFVVGYMAARGRLSKAVFLSSLGFTVIAFMSVRHVNLYFQSHGWDAFIAKDNGVFKKIDGLLNVKGLKAIARSGLGQLWYLSFSTLGMIWVAIFGAVTSAFQFLAQENQVDKGRLGLTEGDWAGFSLFVLLGFLAVFLASAAAITVPVRADHYIYGRYVDGVVPVMVVFAFMCLVRIDFFRSRNSMWSSVLVLLVATLALVVNHMIPAAGKMGVLGLTIPSTIGLHTGSRLVSTLAIGTYIVIASSALVALSGKRSAITALALLSLGFIYSGVSAVHLLQRMASGTRSQMSAIVDVARFVKPQEAGFLFDGTTASAYYLAQAYLPSWDFVSLNASLAERRAGLVVAGGAWGYQAGALPRYELPAASGGSVRFWYQGDPKSFLSKNPVREGEEFISPNNSQIYLIRGLYGLERAADGYGRWTNGDGEFVFAIPSGRVCNLEVSLRNLAKKPLSVSFASVGLSGEADALVDVASGQSARASFPLSGRSAGGVVDLHVRSTTFVPGGADGRKLGVMVTSVRIGSCSSGQ